MDTKDGQIGETTAKDNCMEMASLDEAFYSTRKHSMK